MRMCRSIKRQKGQKTMENNNVSRSDYAYKDIAEYESIIECKVNDSFRAGWTMARTTMEALDALSAAEPCGAERTKE